MRFYVSYTNRRGKTYGAGTRAGDGVHVRGWDAGVRVTAQALLGGVDAFEIYMTSGSHDTSPDVLLGTVRDTPNGPEFAPSKTVNDAFKRVKP
jgi:hypothetical protein